MIATYANPQPQAQVREDPRPAPGVPEDAASLDTTLTLRGGAVVRVRAIRADDTERLRAFHARLSPETVEFRFFGAVPALPPDQAARFTHVDYADRMALVATVGVGAGEQIIAVVRYDRIAPQTAEVAFVVEDRWQHQGIATALLDRLAEYARARGFTTFLAVVMLSNLRMRGLLHSAGFPYTVRYEDGCIEARLDISAPRRPVARQMQPDAGAGVSRP